MAKPTLLPTEANLRRLRRVVSGFYALVGICGFAALLLVGLAFLSDAPQGPWVGPFLLGALGVVVLAHLRPQLATLAAQVRRLAERGQRFPVGAVIVKTVPKVRRRSGHSSPTQYVAIATWRDSQEREQQAQSEAFSYNPAAYLDPARMAVLADPDEPALCQVLADGLPSFHREPEPELAPVVVDGCLSASALSPILRLRDAMPDIAMAGLFAWQLLIYMAWEPWSLAIPGGGLLDGMRQRDPLAGSLLAAIAASEAAFVWLQLTFTDHGLSAKQRMTLREVMPIAIGALLFGGALLWPLLISAGSAALIPLAWSFWQRIQAMRDLARKSRLDRLRAAASASGRWNILCVILVPLALFEIAMAMFEVMHGTSNGMPYSYLHPWLPCAAALVFYLLAAWDQARIGGLTFARRPAPLLGWDYIGMRQISA